MIKKIVLGLLIVIALAGCPSHYSVKIDAMMADDSMKKYELRPAQPWVKESSLEFKEYRAYLDRGLKLAGFEPAANPDKADILILVSYGSVLSYSAETRNVTIPVTDKAAGNTESMSVTGINAGLYYVSFDAFDRKTYLEKQEGELWKTVIRSDEQFGDSMRDVFPYLVAGAIPFLGKELKESDYEHVTQNGDVVRRVKGEPVGK